jgi:hypothetical protein
VLDPADLYQLSADVPPLGAPVLVQALDGFVDAGSVRQIVRQHLLGSFDSRVLARFAHDELIDYRARRPPLTFVQDRWSAYDEPVLALHALTDAGGTPFLLLAGTRARHPVGAVRRRRHAAGRPARRAADDRPQCDPDGRPAHPPRRHDRPWDAT